MRTLEELEGIFRAGGVSRVAILTHLADLVAHVRIQQRELEELRGQALAARLLKEVRTWRQWDAERIDGIEIIDPDGFRDRPDDRLYTREEFLALRVRATIRMPARCGKRFGYEMACTRPAGHDGGCSSESLV